MEEPIGFLLELLSEEMPARLQIYAEQTLRQMVTDKLKTLNLSFSEIQTFVTPRRLGLMIEELPSLQLSLGQEHRGPRIEASPYAVSRFLQRVGPVSVIDFYRENPQNITFTDPNSGFKYGQVNGYWIAWIPDQSKETKTLLPQLIIDTILNFPWPKSMRWGNYGLRWIRPLHHIVAITYHKGDTSLSFKLDGGLDLGIIESLQRKHGLAVKDSSQKEVIAFSDYTFGHHDYHLDPAKKITVTDFANYKAQLKRNGVYIDRQERRNFILEKATSIAAAENLQVQDNPALIDEIVGLVECPRILTGSIDDQFLNLPPEVLIVSMNHHQKYLATFLKDTNQFAKRFIIVSDHTNPDSDQRVIKGNERVLRARLEDAEFFLFGDKEDVVHCLKFNEKKRELTINEESPLFQSLDKLLFHEGLGSMRDKVTRLEDLIESFVSIIPGCNETDAKYAASFCKLDLGTRMVNEFPKLQGIMGAHYLEEWYQSKQKAYEKEEERRKGDLFLDMLIKIEKRYEGKLKRDITDQWHKNTEDRMTVVGWTSYADRQHEVINAVRDHYRPLGPHDHCPNEPNSVTLALADKIDTLVGFFAIGKRPTGSADPLALRRTALGIIRLILDNDLTMPLKDILAKSHATYTKQEAYKSYIKRQKVKQLLSFIIEYSKDTLRDAAIHDVIIGMVLFIDEHTLDMTVKNIIAEGDNADTNDSDLPPRERVIEKLLSLIKARFRSPDHSQSKISKEIEIDDKNLFIRSPRFDIPIKNILDEIYDIYSQEVPDTLPQHKYIKKLLRFMLKNLSFQLRKDSRTTPAAETIELIFDAEDTPPLDMLIKNILKAYDTSNVPLKEVVIKKLLRFIIEHLKSNPNPSIQCRIRDEFILHDEDLRIRVNHPVPIHLLFAKAYDTYKDISSKEIIIKDILSFIFDRLKAQLRDQNIRPEIIDAVFTISREDNLIRLKDRVMTLRDFLTTEGGENLLTAYRRGCKILQIEEKKDKRTYNQYPNTELFEMKEEHDLEQALKSLESKTKNWLEKGDFNKTIDELAQLRGPVDAFFDHVLVNSDVPSLRENRLFLLNRLRDSFNRIANFTYLR